MLHDAVSIDRAEGGSIGNDAIHATMHRCQLASPSFTGALLLRAPYQAVVASLVVADGYRPRSVVERCAGFPRRHCSHRIGRWFEQRIWK